MKPVGVALIRQPVSAMRTAKIISMMAERRTSFEVSQP
jgi:hypothetical protein